MPKIIALANQKGGVGKTTSAINIAASIAAESQRVLLIDLDPQGNATMGSGVNKNDLENTANEWLLGEANFSDVMIATKAGYDLIPANRSLTSAEIHLLNLENREYRLRDAIQSIANHYDFIYIDCPPSLSMLTVNAMAAANGIIVPMQCEYYALEGLTGLMETVDQIKRSTNPHLMLEGILRTMYDPRSRLAVDVSNQLFAHFPDKVYQNAIPRNVRLAEAPSFGLPALLYDKASSGALAYTALAREILHRAGRASQSITMKEEA